MKVLKTIAQNNELSSIIDFSDELFGLNKRVKREALKEIGEFLIEQTLLNIGESKSPVAGEKIPPLTSKDYKQKKAEEVGNKKANLELTGELLDSADYRIVDDSILKIGVFGEEAPKADGHNNFSGKSLLPQRRIFPGHDQSYKTDIKREISRIISDYKAENLDPKIDNELQSVTTKAELYDVLKQVTGLSKKSEIRLAVLRNEALLDLLIENGLQDYI